MPTTAATWQGATASPLPLAAQVNQFLGVHKVQNLYAAVLESSQTTPGTGATNSNGLYMAQSFTTAVGQTAIGYIGVDMQVSTGLGANLGPMTIGIYANSGGAPTGSALGSTVFAVEYCFAQGTFTFVPMPVTGLTASTTYWIVTQPAGNGTYFYPWERSNQTSGASTSTNGTTWTAQTYGFLYEVFDQTASGPLVGTWEDSGARWSWTTYNTAASINQISQYAEYTVAQGSSQYVQSVRNFMYSNGLLTKVA
jgi:hypothetical protein